MAPMMRISLLVLALAGGLVLVCAGGAGRAGVLVAAAACSAADVQILQDFSSNVVTSLIEFQVINNCACPLELLVVDCSDRRWNQRIVNPAGLLMDSPAPGLCTVLPGALIQPASKGVRYGRTYTSPDILPLLPIHTAQFAPPCDH